MADMGYSLSDLRAAVGGDGFGDGNNGFIWLLLLWAMMGGNWNGNRYGCGEFLNKVGVDAASANQIEDLSRQVTQDALRGAIAGNHDAIDSLSKQLCCSTADVTAAISGVNTAMLQGFNGIERLVQSCCCENKTMMLQGFNGVDKSLCSLQNSVERGDAALSNQITSGFSNIGFLIQSTGNSIIQSNEKGVDRLLSYLTGDKIEQLRSQLSLTQNTLSQNEQTNVLLEAIRRSNACGCNNGCNTCGF